jgi:hypothetical protein
MLTPKKVIAVACTAVLLACNFASPENYFDRAVLNSNAISRFGSTEIKEWLSSKPEIYDQQKKAMVPSSYVDFFKFKMSYAEKALNDIADLKETAETKPMLDASKALFSFVLQKEKSAYLDIARMKDQNMPDAAIRQAIARFDDQNLQPFSDKYDVLIKLGKTYADKHHIQVSFN